MTSFWNPFDTKEEKEERKRLEKFERKKQHNESLISNRIIRDISMLFEQEDEN